MAAPIDLPPVTGAELYTQIKRMSTESSLGLDGFTVRELQHLLECAWNLMAQLLTVCEDVQFPPESYHLCNNNYRFDVVQIHCFRINIKL